MPRGPLPITIESTPDVTIMLVGMGERLALLCSAAAIDLGLRPTRVPEPSHACARILMNAPNLVVVVPAGFGRDDAMTASIREAAAFVQAELVELPSVVDPRRIGQAISLGAARARAKALR